ncbi:hypothetical protein HPB49_000455 [Dermacentor silvarum]|uniref:Uncharacterized protein n=1 Tax=Dermacentor silvarum TaxID=543639 RepID=A0ACB8D1N1_DERSI|nr:hypothetical protein HPB49_000455 [Dermacentor silvarum]
MARCWSWDRWNYCSPVPQHGPDSVHSWLVAAIGAGMVFIVAPTIISEHFVKNKGLAMGLNFAGVTAGLFVFPKLLEHLTATYGLRGALLIFGAVTMNGLAFSLFPRTPAWRKALQARVNSLFNFLRKPSKTQEPTSYAMH